MHNMYVRSLRLRAKLMTPDRETDTHTERERQLQKAQGIVPHLFFKWGSLEKSRSQLAKFFLNKIKNMYFNFDIVLKSVVGMQ